MALIIEPEYIEVFLEEKLCYYLYRHTVHFVVYLSNKPTNAHI